MSFRILGLDPTPFLSLYGQSSEVLVESGVRRLVVEANPGYPDRVELRDLEIGETVLLMNHVHQPANTAYYASHAIFVREGALTPYDKVGEVPEVLLRRPLSLRGFDLDGEMIDADLVQGVEASSLIERLFQNPLIDYIHAHYAKRGCYAARIERA